MTVWIRALENEFRFARPRPERKKSFEQSHLELRMFRVAEGETVLLVFPGRRAWLVDCGNTSQVDDNENLAKAMAQYLEGRNLTLEACVASHSHMDHMGALETLLASDSSALAPEVTVYRTTAKWGREANFLTRYNDMVANSNGRVVERIFEPQTADIVNIGLGIDAHLFVASGASVYTPLFMRLSYGSARLLFTGDADMAYERRLLKQFSPAHMRADVLKVTHHGSSSGTSPEAVAATKPALAISSSSHDEDHRLEADTRARLLNTPVGKRRIFDTATDGDIVVETDGGNYLGGVLYRVETERPGQFASV